MTKVKICGLSDYESINAAVEAGVDYLGFVFAKSKRQVSPQKTKELTRHLPAHIQKVGVFVNPTQDNLKRILDVVDLDVLQIHGHYDIGLCEHFGLPIIRAMSVGRDVREQVGADYYLFDGLVSGSGQTFDWEMLNTRHLRRPYFIAGGLTIENVKSCIERFHPYGVDVSSGVETNGQKDRAKIKAFLKEVKDGLS